MIQNYKIPRMFAFYSKQKIPGLAPARVGCKHALITLCKGWKVFVCYVGNVATLLSSEYMQTLFNLSFQSICLWSSGQ